MIIPRSIAKTARNQQGFSILELLIAVLITAVIAAAAFQFYVTMNQNVITQQEISDMQQISRSCLQEISKTLRMAGYMLSTIDPTHPAYEIIGDDLYVYVGCIDAGCPDPIDTTRYYLEEFTVAEYAAVPALPSGMQIYKLMKQEDEGAAAEIYADFVKSIMFTPIGTGDEEMAITLEVQTSMGDETHSGNDGFRTFSNTERVSMRNVSM